MRDLLRGASLLEAVFAVGLASIFAAAASRHAHQRLADLNRLRVTATALTAARNLLEASLGAPCGDAASIAPCPDEFLCTRNRSALGSHVASSQETLSRVEVEVEVSERAAERRTLARLATVLPVLSDCSDGG